MGILQDFIVLENNIEQSILAVFEIE